MSSVGKCLATPVWGWLDLVETTRGDGCSLKFVKINNSAFLPLFAFQGVAIVSVTRSLWPAAPSVSFANFAGRLWPD